MWDKLHEVEKRFENLSDKLSNPEFIADRDAFQKAAREHKELTEIVSAFRAFRKAKEEYEGAKLLLGETKDPDMRTMAEEEVHLLQRELEGLEKMLRLLLLPKDPNDSKNVVLEIRAGTGGDEAGIFVGDLLKMYTRYIEGRGWKLELLGVSDSAKGGYKEIIAMVYGDGAFSRLKYERGVHRVQRVPETEAQGRIHTSTATVAVLPEAEDIDIKIEDKDLRVDVFRSGGPGGQSVNTTDSAVRLTHLPSGIVVSMQDEKSQIKNRAKAMKVLKARLLEKEQNEQDAARAADRRSQVGTGERSERIRTYNYPQSRITDHRIGLTLYDLATVVNGDLDQLIDPLTGHFQAEALKSKSE